MTTTTTEKVIEKATEVAVDTGITEVMNKLTQATEVISSKIIDAAPEAAKILLTAVQVTSGVNLIVSTAVLLLPLLVWKFGFKRYWSKLPEKENGTWDVDEEQLFTMFILTGVIMILLTIVALVTLSSWTQYMIGTISPATILVLKALSAVGINII